MLRVTAYAQPAIGLVRGRGRGRGRGWVRVRVRVGLGIGLGVGIGLGFRVRDRWPGRQSPSWARVSQPVG